MAATIYPVSGIVSVGAACHHAAVQASVREASEVQLTSLRRLPTVGPAGGAGHDRQTGLRPHGADATHTERPRRAVRPHGGRSLKDLYLHARRLDLESRCAAYRVHRTVVRLPTVAPGELDGDDGSP